ncbi:MAG: Transcriptional regulator containing an amidase domain and an AraC-type DNA-binding HTH domain [Rhodobacteraceae bacterium HLUCCO07]|nr:MAG: Transcriptional regulator containing an amidase domain and an AraC-type DNA-binding HTH domain [Rhodobacteraceae bacterium HLUCCO07]
MADDIDKLEVAIILVNEGYASTAIGPLEVFASAGAMWNEMRGAQPEPLFRVSTASMDGRPVESAYGLRIAPDCALADLGPVDIVMVSASGPMPAEWMTRHAGLLPWLRKRYNNGTLIAGVCSGVAFLAEAGLLDGRRATTHWGVAETFRTRYPRVHWRTDLLITEDSGLFCSGGVNAASDLGLYLVERFCGHRVAVEAARALLLDMPRPSQSGYAILPLSRPRGDAQVRKAEDHLSTHFRRDVPTDELAELVGMSRRNLVRRFKAATGSRPGSYTQMLRVAAARALLEDGAASIEQVSLSVGYCDVGFFRRVFKRYSGMPPAAYRDQFGPRRRSWPLRRPNGSRRPSNQAGCPTGQG